MFKVTKLAYVGTEMKSPWKWRQYETSEHWTTSQERNQNIKTFDSTYNMCSESIWSVCDIYDKRSENKFTRQMIS
jgi:hypothetical protein